MPDAPARHGPDTPDPLAALVLHLRGAGLEPDAEGLSDALWLARWTGEREPTGAVEQGRETTRETPPPPSAPQPEPRLPSAPKEPEVLAPGPDRSVPLYPAPRDDHPRTRTTARLTALPVGVPAAPALPSALELQRALRPLQAYRSAAPPLRRTLDETATAELSAQAGGLILPVYREVRRGDTRLQLVLDAAPSMRVWDRLFAELQDVFAQLGAFGDIRIAHLHTGPDGEATVSASVDPRGAPQHTVDRLSDPTGRRITLLVSDCAGPLWRSGRAHRLLHRLARLAPVAVLQPLPQRLWSRTRLPVTYGELTRGDAPGGTALRVRTPDGAPLVPPPGVLPVPVLPPEPVALGAWARLLAGAGAGPVPGAVGWVRADQPPAPRVLAGRGPTPVERVSRFRSTASPAAGRLAVYLAAAPLSLPVMRLVQRTMLPGSGPAELAEVLLGGLVRRAGEDHGPDAGQWYEMEPEVREALLSTLGRDEALLVLKHCSEYIEQRFGKGGANFPALALAQLGGTGLPGRGDESPVEARLFGAYPGDGGDATLVPQPFAEVAARVLERFMPLPEQFRLYGTRPGTAAGPRPAHPAVVRARTLLARFDADGMVQDVIDAVQLLRGATENERPAGDDPALWAEYAHAVLRLWEVQGGPALLAEAEAAAERAVAHPHAQRERAALARVLRAAATDRRRRGDRPAALDLLRRADREYAVACAAPDLEPAQALRLTLERVGALEAQWRLGGDSALLQGAVGMLEAFADIWPDRAHRPPELPLAHGRLLLRLADATNDPVQARGYAAQAARSLRDALAAGEDGGRELVLVRLDLVDALLRSGGDLAEAQERVDAALAVTTGRALRARLHVRTGRIGVARYAETGDLRELRDAADAFARAAADTSREATEYPGVLAEWGEVLLRRADAESGERAWEALAHAIRVLRDCRRETHTGSPHTAHRLLMLGRALIRRYRLRGDRVDLREAEHLFGLAAAEADEPLLAARCYLELGQAQYEAYRSLARPTRLDDAVDAFRAAAESAREAGTAAESDRDRRIAVELCAQAHHWRGMSYEAASRPRAAREAYRAARAEWARLPEDSLGTGAPTAEDTADRLTGLG
ncbi:SAV_2336 N-terminal domain-related protein [Streptomyces sp. NPDC048241]|uniref:SAV_2336 N-terminal domain-related protein n=1 Tax=Streptomyces sp. NPDC048241 TaxID=3365521 RepID=UPI0037226302